jgi:hypothetical protein
MLPGNDPGNYRSDLPRLDKESRPVGYRAGWQLEERLQGLGAMILGIVGLTVAYLIFTGVLPAGLPPPQPPPGVLVQVPVFNANQCLVPLTAIGSVALIVVGFRRALDP